MVNVAVPSGPVLTSSRAPYIFLTSIHETKQCLPHLAARFTYVKYPQSALNVCPSMGLVSSTVATGDQQRSSGAVMHIYGVNFVRRGKRQASGINSIIYPGRRRSHTTDFIMPRTITLHDHGHMWTIYVVPSSKVSRFVTPKVLITLRNSRYLNKRVYILILVIKGKLINIQHSIFKI